MKGKGRAPPFLPQELSENPLKFTFIKKNMVLKFVDLFSNAVQEEGKKEFLFTNKDQLHSRKHPGLNAQNALRHFSILKPSSRQPLGEAVVHLEKDQLACDGGVSIKLAI